MTDEIKKKQAERKLTEINAMIKRSGATPLLLKRKAELEKEFQKHDEKRQAHARSLWNKLIEKRGELAKEVR